MQKSYTIGAIVNLFHTNSDDTTQEKGDFFAKVVRFVRFLVLCRRRGSPRRLFPAGAGYRTLPVFFPARCYSQLLLDQCSQKKKDFIFFTE